MTLGVKAIHHMPGLVKIRTIGTFSIAFNFGAFLFYLLYVAILDNTPKTQNRRTLHLHGLLLGKFTCMFKTGCKCNRAVTTVKKDTSEHHMRHIYKYTPTHIE